MKKTLSLLLLGFALVGATPTFYQGFGNGIGPNGDKTPFEADPAGSSFLLMDVLLDPADVVVTKPVDLFKIPYLYRDSAQATTAGYTPIFQAGSVTLSCYDASDSAAVTDSVDVTALVQKSQYAGDNFDPSRVQGGTAGGKNGPWTTVATLSLDDASANQAILDTRSTITLANESDRFLRVQITNDNATIKDRSRCRAYWVRKPILR